MPQHLLFTKKSKTPRLCRGLQHRHRYRYAISAEGKATLIDGEYLEGEPKGVTGKKTRETHLAMLNKFLSRAEYEPVVLDGEPKALINLSADLEIGANYQE